MHYLISRASTLKTSSCLCFSSMIVFFHVIVTLASSVPYTQLGDSSCLQASLSIRSPRGSMSIWLGQALCRPTFPLLAAVLRMTRIPPSSAQFPNCSKEKLFLRQFLLCGPIGMALEHLCHADGWRWSFSPHSPAPRSQTISVCWFPGRGSAHCDFSATALGDNVQQFLKLKSPFPWHSIDTSAVKMSESIKTLHYPLRRWKGQSFRVGAKVKSYVPSMQTFTSAPSSALNSL